MKCAVSNSCDVPKLAIRVLKTVLSFRKDWNGNLLALICYIKYIIRKSTIHICSRTHSARLSAFLEFYRLILVLLYNKVLCRRSSALF